MGYIGNRHASIISGHPDCELVAICESDDQKRHTSEKKYGLPAFADSREMLAYMPEIEVVCVCTPNGLHTQHALEALEHNKHVVIEKPMGLKRAQCEQVLSSALQRSRQVFIVMQNRYSPPSVWLKEIMDSGKLGKVRMVEINCYWNRDDRYYSASDWKGSLDMDGGPLFTQFSHFIDIMVWLFGDISNIQARFHNFNHRHNTQFEDSGLVAFELESGGMGTLNYSTAIWDKNFQSSLTIIGEKGTVKVGGQYMDKVEYCHVEDYQMPELPASNPPNDYGQWKGSAANHHFVFENVVQTLRGDSTITTNAMEGLKVVDIIERIYAQRDV